MAKNEPAASSAWDSNYPWWARAYFQGGALFVVCALLLLMYSDFRATQKEDAKNHREDMAAFRQEMRHQVDMATSSAKVIADAMAANQRAIDTNQRDIVSILKVLTMLTEEVHRLKGKPDEVPVRHGLQSRLRLEGTRV